MADQKVTARVALITGVDPVNDILPIVDISAGASGSKKITINDLFTGWGMTPAGEALAKSATLQSQKDLLGVNVNYSPTIIGLTGGGPARLDGVPTVGLAANTLHFVITSANQVYYYRLRQGVFAEDLPNIVLPDDFAPTTNEKAWELVGLVSNHVDIIQLSAENVLTRGISIYNDFGAVSLKADAVTNTRIQNLPDMDGTIALEDNVSFLVTTNNYTIGVSSGVNHTFILEPASAVSPVNLVLPGWELAKVGQRVSLISDFAAAVFVPSVDVSGVLQGPALTSLAANTMYEYICKSIAGTVATWKRIK